MDIYSFNLKPYKSAFYTLLSVNAVITLATYIAGANVLGIVLLQGDFRTQTNILFGILIVAAIFQTSRQKKLLEKINSFTDYEAKTVHYFKLYKMRLYWKCVSCISSCFIYLLTGRNLFLYFAVFDVLTSGMYFPHKTLIRKELKIEDLVFVEE
jgi:hypothetical protein